MEYNDPKIKELLDLQKNIENKLKTLEEKGDISDNQLEELSKLIQLIDLKLTPEINDPEKAPDLSIFDPDNFKINPDSLNEEEDD